MISMFQNSKGFFQVFIWFDFSVAFSVFLFSLRKSPVWGSALSFESFICVLWVYHHLPPFWKLIDYFPSDPWILITLAWYFHLDGSPLWWLTDFKNITYLKLNSYFLGLICSPSFLPVSLVAAAIQVFRAATGLMTWSLPSLPPSSVKPIRFQFRPQCVDLIHSPSSLPP